MWRHGYSSTSLATAFASPGEKKGSPPKHCTSAMIRKRTNYLVQPRFGFCVGGSLSPGSILTVRPLLTFPPRGPTS
uniref:Uncharacterized protein n=1 Tax=Siphoviridae sp. ct0d96 TaxID=2826268 RepID=A0A8S5M4D9_9CAUD|nr:MAG TPA: hypothetical protein [Siphoviridae sp. ct0d96]